MAEIDIVAAWNASLATLTKNDQSQRSLLDTADAWRIATEYLDPITRTFCLPGHTCSPTTLQALQRISEARLSDNLLRHYFDAISKNFNVVEADVSNYLSRWQASLDPSIISDLLHRIGSWIQTWQIPVDLFWPTSAHLLSYRRHFLSSLYSILPSAFSPAFTSYLRSIISATSPSLASTSLSKLTLIALLERYDTLLFALLYEEIEIKVVAVCAGEYGSSKMSTLVDWLSTEVMDCLCSIYSASAEGGRNDAKKMLKPTCSRFEYHLYKVLGQLRTKELFDIIIQFPKSQPALQDLAICLVKTDQRGILVAQLRMIMSQRLLHPGADTKFIIDTYISTIRSLRVLDPQGVLLSRVAEPIRQYLRSRDDTIRCVVALLTDKMSDLFEELSLNADAPPVQDAKDAAEDYNDPKWLPDPIDAPPDFRKSKGSDIIQSLVSIYDTKEVFVKELQVRIAQQLLAIQDYALEREVTTVDILKRRFGEASLQGCEVMIKDLQDSKRIDQAIHQRVTVPIRATIVSRLFWPSFQNTPLRLPGQLGRYQSDYEQTFIRLKPDKKLRWLPQLGTVNITVDLTDRSLTLDVSPLQASIIELFSIRDVWTVDDLATRLRVTDAASVLNGLYFWNNNGVLKNLSDTAWQLLETVDTSRDAQTAHVIEDAGLGVQSVEALQIEQMSIYATYILGMLGNLKAMPISRIQAMLSTLVTSYKGHTVDELLGLLESIQGQGLIEKTSKGDWKIVKQ